MKGGTYRLRCDRANKSGALFGMHRVMFRDIGAAPSVPGIEITDEKRQPYKPKPLRVPANYTRTSRRRPSRTLKSTRERRL